MTTDTVGGVLTYSIELIRGLHRHGVEVVLATFGPRPSAQQRRRIAGAGAAAVHETDLALEWMPDPWRDLEATQELLLALEAEVRPDIVHLNAFAPGRAPFDAPVLVVGHSCVWSWWSAVHRQAPPAEWNRYRATVRAGLAGADAVVAPSQTMLAALKRWYGPLPDSCVTIFNGSGDGDPAPATVLKRPLVLSAGRVWDEAKNIATLIRAADRPALRGRVVVAGEQVPAAHAAREAGTRDTISAATPGGATLLGPLVPAELARIRRRASIYAAPARYEPFGLGILEAARDRCALVLGDIPSLHEIWGDAAVYVAPDDEEQLGRTLERLLEDTAAAHRLGERACHAAARFSAAATAGAYRRLYRQLERPPKRIAA